MRLAVVQYQPTADRDQNLGRVGEMIDQAAKNGAQFVLLPELYGIPFVPTDADPGYFAYSETLNGPSNTLAAGRSRQHGIAVLSAFFEEAPQPGVYHNSVRAYVAGQPVLLYRKSHIPLSHHFHEKAYFRPGEKAPSTFPVADVEVGVIICYERHFPELFRSVALQGAHVVMVPVATANTSERIFHAELRGHAIANGVYVATANRIGVEGKNRYYGRSAIFAPDGEELAAAGAAEEIIYADVEPAQVVAARQDFPFFRDRRPELYTDVVAGQDSIGGE